MVKKILGIGVIAIGALVLNGCATVSKNDDQGLRNRISVLEAQLSEKDNELNALKESMGKAGEVAPGVSGALEVKPGFDVKMIQAALKNAGYFQDEVDGKMGRKTRQAVKEFQKANNLTADGKVGKKTWSVLKEYLESKVK
ncbi:MAG: peptidoglycan-binding domain-containing protein [Candidatus Omnitrophica bacterium]|nr:peptidoglycan-binding domain-containing protein [Candidatus Omnitrophota bacterium]